MAFLHFLPKISLLLLIYKIYTVDVLSEIQTMQAFSDLFNGMYAKYKWNSKANC